MVLGKVIRKIFGNPNKFLHRLIKRGQFFLLQLLDPHNGAIWPIDSRREHDFSVLYGGGDASCDTHWIRCRQEASKASRGELSILLQPLRIAASHLLIDVCRQSLAFYRQFLHGFNRRLAGLGVIVKVDRTVFKPQGDRIGSGFVMRHAGIPANALVLLHDSIYAGL